MDFTSWDNDVVDDNNDHEAAIGNDYYEEDRGKEFHGGEERARKPRIDVAQIRLAKAKEIVASVIETVITTLMRRNRKYQGGAIMVSKGHTMPSHKVEQVSLVKRKPSGVKDKQDIKLKADATESKGINQSCSVSSIATKKAKRPKKAKKQQK